MRVALFLLVVATAVSSVAAPAAAQDALVASVWTGSRADTLPEGRFEVGVFSPLKYGFSDDVELSTHPIAFFLLPNASAKVSWNDDQPWRVATRHGIHYPTLLLRMLSREGPGLLPDTTDVPEIIAFTNEVLMTTNVPLFRRWFTLRLGFTVAPRFGGEPLPALELPVLFPRTAAYSTFITGHAAIALEGQIVGAFYYLADSAMFVMPGFEGAFAFENTVQLSWRPSEHFMLTGGARAIYGGYPYGSRLHVMPVADAKWGF